MNSWKSSSVLECGVAVMSSRWRAVPPSTCGEKDQERVRRQSRSPRKAATDLPGSISEVTAVFEAATLPPRWPLPERGERRSQRRVMSRLQRPGR
jgi:hypothetical protein